MWRGTLHPSVHQTHPHRIHHARLYPHKSNNIKASCVWGLLKKKKKKDEKLRYIPLSMIYIE